MIALLPFTPSPLTQNLRVSAQIHRKNSGFLLEFQIDGDLASLEWPETFATIESRQDGLWTETCLEAFFAEDQRPESPYVEINCSPNGNWNFYHLSSYRQGLRPLPEGRVRLLEREGVSQGVHFVISVEGLPFASPSLYVGLTAVLKHREGPLSHWALAHTAVDKADFHNKKSFQFHI